MTISPLCYFDLGCGDCNVEVNPHLVAQFQSYAQANSLPSVKGLNPARIGGLCEDFAAVEEAVTPGTEIAPGCFAAPWFDELCPETSGCAFGFMFHGSAEDGRKFTVQSPNELTASQTSKARAKGCVIQDGRRFGKFYVEAIATNRQSALWLADWFTNKMMSQSRCCSPGMDVFVHCCDLDGKSGRRTLTDVGEINVECVDGDTFTECGVLLEVVFTAGNLVTESDDLICGEICEPVTECMPQCPPETEIVEVETLTPKVRCNGDVIRNNDGTLRFCNYDFDTFDATDCLLKVRAIDADGADAEDCCPIVISRIDLTGLGDLIQPAQRPLYQTEILNRVFNGTGIDCSCPPLIEMVRIPQEPETDCPDCPGGEGSSEECADEFGIVLAGGIPDIAASFPNATLPLAKGSPEVQALIDFTDCAGLSRPVEQHDDTQPPGNDETQTFDDLSVGIDPATGEPAWCMETVDLVWPPGGTPSTEVCTDFPQGPFDPGTPPDPDDPDDDGDPGEVGCIEDVGILVNSVNMTDLVSDPGPGPHSPGSPIWNQLVAYADCVGFSFPTGGDSQVIKVNPATGVLAVCIVTFGTPGGNPSFENQVITYTAFSGEAAAGECGVEIPLHCLPYVDVEYSGSGPCVLIDFDQFGATTLTYEANGQPISLPVNPDTDDLTLARFKFGPCSVVEEDDCPPFIPPIAELSVDTTTGVVTPLNFTVGPDWPYETTASQYVIVTTDQGDNVDEPIVTTETVEQPISSSGACEPPCGAVRKRPATQTDSCWPECLDDERQIIVGVIQGLNPALEYLPSWTVTAGGETINHAEVFLFGGPADFQSPQTNLAAYLCGLPDIPKVQSLQIPAGGSLSLANDELTLACHGKCLDAGDGWVAAGSRPQGRPRLTCTETAYVVVTLPCEVEAPTVEFCVEPVVRGS